MSIVSYAASDPYGQLSRGVVVITVVAPSGEIRSADTEAQARTRLLEEAKRYVAGLDGAEHSAKVGVGPAPIGLVAFSSRKARASTCRWPGRRKWAPVAQRPHPHAGGPDRPCRPGRHRLRAQNRLGCGASRRVRAGARRRQFDPSAGLGEAGARPLRRRGCSALRPPGRGARQAPERDRRPQSDRGLPASDGRASRRRPLPLPTRPRLSCRRRRRQGETGFE